MSFDECRITNTTSFPNSVWECMFSKLCFVFDDPRKAYAIGSIAKRSFAELRSQTEFGNEENFMLTETTLLQLPPLAPSRLFFLLQNIRVIVDVLIQRFGTLLDQSQHRSRVATGTNRKVVNDKLQSASQLNIETLRRKGHRTHLNLITGPR